MAKPIQGLEEVAAAIDDDEGQDTNDNFTVPTTITMEDDDSSGDSNSLS